MLDRDTIQGLQVAAIGMVVGLTFAFAMALCSDPVTASTAVDIIIVGE